MVQWLAHPWLGTVDRGEVYLALPGRRITLLIVRGYGWFGRLVFDSWWVRFFYILVFGGLVGIKCMCRQR